MSLVGPPFQAEGQVLSESTMNGGWLFSLTGIQFGQHGSTTLPKQHSPVRQNQLHYGNRLPFSADSPVSGYFFSYTLKKLTGKNTTLNPPIYLPA